MKDQTSLNLDGLSPQLQLLIRMEQKQKELESSITHTNRRIDNMQDVIALNPNSWREEARRLIVKIAATMGGNAYIKDVTGEIYNLLEQRGGVNLTTRLTNKRRRMVDEGACKSQRDKVNKVDIIAEDKKLVEIYDICKVLDISPEEIHKYFPDRRTQIIEKAKPIPASEWSEKRDIVV